MSAAPSPIAERLATAAELQDLLAHRVTALSVQAAAAAQAGSGADAELRGRLTAIATLAGQAMTDLRRLGRVLDRGAPAAYRPQPSLDALPALRVVLDGGGVADGDVGDSIALCAYRAVELVAEHCRVRDSEPPAVALRVDGSSLWLTIAFGSGGCGDRRTVERLRERLRPCGGVLRTDPTRWHARLPLEA